MEPCLHVGVVGPPGAFRRNPHDVLRRVLDVTSLAVNTVLRVDLEAFATLVVVYYLIDTCRTVTLGRFIVHRQVLLDRNARIDQFEVNRLLLFMVSVGEKYRAELVEAELPVRLGVVDLLRLGSCLQARIVGLGVVQRERNLAAEDVLIDEVERATLDGAPLVDRCAEVAAGI